MALLDWVEARPATPLHVESTTTASEAGSDDRSLNRSERLKLPKESNREA
jgi:hypothetical protein